MTSLLSIQAVALAMALSSVTDGSSDNVLESFPISHDVRPIVIPVSLGGKSHLFLVDTGSTFTVFDTSLSGILGNEIERKVLSTPGGPREFQFAIPMAAFVGRQPLCEDSLVALMDMERFREASGLDIRGCLGMNFLAKYVVRIDFDAGKLELLKSATSTVGQRLPLRLKGDRPWVEVSIEPIGTQEFLIDTGHVGMDTGSLTADVMRTLEEAGKLRPARTARVETGAGRMEVNLGFVDNVKIGSFLHKTLLFSTARDHNALGLSFCERYIATFDFPNGALFLEAGKQHTLEDQPGGSGLAFLRQDGKAVVERVRDGSPAARAGLQRGDELLLIGGRKTEGACSASLGRMLCGRDRTVKVVFRRGEDIREVEVKLDSAWSAPSQGN